jgi:hypothetical protein
MLWGPESDEMIQSHLLFLNQAAVAGSSSAGALRNGDHSDRTDVRFARPNIQIYDAYVVDLHQWVCARYFVGVEVQKQRQSAVKLGSRPNFRTDHAGFPNPVRPKAIRGSTIEIRKFTLYFNRMTERVSVNPH